MKNTYASNSPAHERGNAMVLALLAMMLGVAVMLWVTQVSAENFRRTDRHMFQEDTFYAAQGAADAIVADINQAYTIAYGNGSTPAALDFKGWLANYRPAIAALSDDKGSLELAEWAGRSFNAATINRARITKEAAGSNSQGFYVSFRVEVEAAPTNSSDPADFITVTRILNATNRQPPDTEYAILTENISCTVCHLRVSTLEFAKNVQGEAAGNKYKRALIATTKYMNARFDSADSEIHGTFYISAGARVENHGHAADLSTALNNGQFRMADLTKAESPDADGISRSTFSEILDNQGKPTGKVNLTNNLADSSDPLEAGKPLYLKYPGKGDYDLDDKFPSPFPDIGDSNGNGAKNRKIDPVELDDKKSLSVGTIKSNFVTRVAPNTNQNYAQGTYTYTDPTMPSSATPGTLEEIRTGEANNLILIGTKENPIEINGQVVIEGDVMIKGFVKGTGLLMATGNVYIPTDVQYVNPTDADGNEVFAETNRIGYAAGGNIVIGDYISKVTSHSSNYDNGRVEVGKPEGAGWNYANYVAEQLAISNRDELAKTLKKVPNGGGDLASAGTYGVTNTAYDPTYTPRYYTMYPDTEPYAFIKNNYGAAKFNTSHKAWETGETPNIYVRDQFSVVDVPAEVRNTDVVPRVISVHPNWISPENMIKLIANEETKRIADEERNKKPFRIDGLLYTNNAIFSIQRRKSQISNGNGGWSRVDASHKGEMEINGSVIAPDLGILVAGGAKDAFKVNYDRRLRNLISGFEPGKWSLTIDGFARFSGPMP